MNNPINTGPISTGTAASNNNQSQASGSNVSKVLGGIGPTVDRSAFRQQPPPMKVKLINLQSISYLTNHLYLDLSIMSTTNSSQCTDLSYLQSKKSFTQSEKTKTSSYRYKFLIILKTNFLYIKYFFCFVF